MSDTSALEAARKVSAAIQSMQGKRLAIAFKDDASARHVGTVIENAGIVARALLAANRRAGQDGRRQAIEECAKVIDQRIADLQDQRAEHNKWGNWPRAATVEDHILELKRNAAAIRALPSQDEGWREIETDAQRWRALMSSQRIRVMGSAGFEMVGGEWIPGRRDLHMGVEFWSLHPAAHPSAEYPQDRCRSQFIAYVDSLIAAPPAKAHEGEKDEE